MQRAEVIAQSSPCDKWDLPSQPNLVLMIDVLFFA